MAAISQTMLSNAFSWMKMYEFRLRFHWSLFLGFQYSSIGSDNSLALFRRQAIIWMQVLTYLLAWWQRFMLAYDYTTYILFMWWKIMISMYRLWLHGLYGLYGPRWPLSEKGRINFITHLPTTYEDTMGPFCKCIYHRNSDSMANMF